MLDSAPELKLDRINRWRAPMVERRLIMHAIHTGANIHIRAGEREGLRFIITAEDDGYVECTTSLASGRAPGVGKVNAFFHYWGITPISELISPEPMQARYFVIRESSAPQ